jgi:hypothetical protein
MGLAFDEWDLDYYTALFRDDMKRDPTNVELFDIAQSNSEHSRHWFFRGNIVIDGVSVRPNTALHDCLECRWQPPSGWASLTRACQAAWQRRADGREPAWRGVWA